MRSCATMTGIAMLPFMSLLTVPFPAQSEKYHADEAMKSAKYPNILIVLSDDQGYGDLSCHGNPILRTPNLDRLNNEAIRLTEFHVSGICTPTRSQLLTGVDNLRNRACQWGYGLEFIRRDIPTIAEIFKYRGYCTDVFFKETMRFMLERSKKNKPFLTYLATNAVHDPCFVDKKYRQPYLNRKFKEQPLPPNVISYFGMVANLDENMGRLDSFMTKNKLRENTIVIFMSDNGGVQGVPIYDAGMAGTKGSLLEGGHRQSCFIRWRLTGFKDGWQLNDLDSDPYQKTDVAAMHPDIVEFDYVKNSPLEKHYGDLLKVYGGSNNVCLLCQY